MHAKSRLPFALIVLGLFLAAPATAQQADSLKVYARGDYAEVVKLLTPLHEAGKANIQQRLILARAQLHLKQRDPAMATLKSVLAADKENPEANFLTGRTLYEQGKFEDALPLLEKAYQLKADAATAGLLGRCYYAHGYPVEAKARLEEALEGDIRDPGNSLLLGKICLARGYGALAEKYLLMAEEAGLKTKELHELLAKAYLMQWKYVGPVQVRRLDKPAKPGDIVDGMVVLAPVPAAPGRYRLATRFSAIYEGYRMLRDDAGSIDARFLLTIGWLAANDPAQAEKHLAPLARAEPDSERAAELQARLSLAKRDWAALHKFLPAAEEAGAIKPARVADLYYRAALALRARGDRVQAVRMLAEAEKRTPTSERILRSLATLHRAEGRTDKARAYYARLVELLPDAPDIDELRNTLRVLGEKKGGAK